MISSNTINQPRTEAVGVNLKESWKVKITKILKSLNVEYMLCSYLLPIYMLKICLENLALQKACLVNLRYPEVICTNMIDKSVNKINCSIDDNNMELDNNNRIIRKSTLNSSFNFNNITNISGFEEIVCEAEVESQLLDSRLNLYTAPVDLIFPIITLIFIGAWSDRKIRRKPLMILPLVGEVINLTCLSIAAIFMKELPMEFSSIIRKLIPGLTGAMYLLIMGTYLYLTDITTKEERLFRFGIFSTFISIASIIGSPISGLIFRKFGYLVSFIIGIIINLIGIIYGRFFLAEVPHTIKKSSVGQICDGPEGIINTGYIPSNDECTVNNVNAIADNEIEAKTFSMNLTRYCKNLLAFFNPEIFWDYIKIIIKKRPNHNRRMVIFIIILYFLCRAPDSEMINLYNFTRIKFNWSGYEFGMFIGYGSFLSLIGTLSIACGLKTYLKLSDAMAGTIGISCCAISKLISASASGSILLYVGATVDCFNSLQNISVKSIIPMFIESKEIARTFSILAVVEAIAKFSYISIFTTIYQHTIEIFPGAFYIFSFCCLTIGAIFYLSLHFIIERRNKRNVTGEDRQNNGV